MGDERERLRVSDAERQAAAESLGAAFRDGRLDTGEYEERVGHAYSAVTYADLDRLFADLPRPVARMTPPPYGSPSRFPQRLGSVGEVRSTALQLLLILVTAGIWAYVYFFQTHDEMRRHSGQGIGGVPALLISLFVTVASPFLLSHEVGGLYAREGRPRRVSALTGLWFFPGIFLLVGPIIWFVLTNSALNDYWRSRGAR